jgi:quercetin dioxygenase-like cupin family protein
MQLLTLASLKKYSETAYLKQELAVTENCKVLLICFEPGQSVEPCVMSRNTMFHIVEGIGKVVEAGLEKPVSAGDIVFIKPEVERQLKAETRMVVLAVQYI